MFIRVFKLSIINDFTAANGIETICVLVRSHCLTAPSYTAFLRMGDNPAEAFRRSVLGVQQHLSCVCNELQGHWNKAVQPVAQRLLTTAQNLTNRRTSANLPPHLAVRLS